MRRWTTRTWLCAAFAASAACSNVLGFDELAFDTPGSDAAGSDAGPGGAAGASGAASGGTGGVDASAGGSGAVDASAGSGGAAGSAGTGGSAGAGHAGHGGSSGSAGSAGTAGQGSAGTAGNAGTAGSGGGSVYPPALDLGDVTWLHTDVSGWPVTVNLSSVTFDGGQICLHHDIASKNWPIGNISGTDVVANPWVFIYHDDRWYGATWEWLRPPGQTCKNMSSVAGDHIKVAPFDAASGWTPQSGETLYFMVSGLARLGLSNVQERSEPVKVVWP